MLSEFGVQTGNEVMQDIALLIDLYVYFNQREMHGQEMWMSIFMEDEIFEQMDEVVLTFPGVVVLHPHFEECG